MPRRASGRITLLTIQCSKKNKKTKEISIQRQLTKELTKGLTKELTKGLTKDLIKDSTVDSMVDSMVASAKGPVMSIPMCNGNCRLSDAIGANARYGLECGST